VSTAAAEAARAPERPLGAVGLVFAPLVVLTALTVLEVLAQREGFAASAPITGAVVYAGWALWTFQRARHAGFDIRAFLRPPERARDWRLLSIVPALLLVAVAGLYLGFLLLSLVSPETVSVWIASGPSPDAAAPVLIVLLRSIRRVVLGPVVEEILFRGLLVHLWAQKLGVRTAVLGSSLCFALLHMDPIGSFVFGIVMVALYIRTGSLLVPIVAHALYNAAVVVASATPSGDRGVTTLAELRELWPAMAFLLAATLLVVILFVRAVVRDGWNLPSAQTLPSLAATSALGNPSRA
jgi:membrane protease YdiL (CAAX protease family)